MTKYQRHQSVISRQSDSSSTDSFWSDRYQDTLDKSAVTSRQNHNIYDELNSIMNGAKSKYTSVQAAVEDMKKRSGLTDYLDKINKQSENESKEDQKVVTAQSTKGQDDSVPIVIRQCPQILQTLQNIIRDTNGNSSLPAIIQRLQTIHSKDITDSAEWDDERLIRLVSKMNLEAKSQHPEVQNNFSHLGLRDKDMNADIDPSNTDAFHGLMPQRS